MVLKANDTLYDYWFGMCVLEHMISYKMEILYVFLMETESEYLGSQLVSIVEDLLREPIIGILSLRERPQFVEVYGGTVETRQYIVVEIKQRLGCVVFGCDEESTNDSFYSFYRIDLNYFLKKDYSSR